MHSKKFYRQFAAFTAGIKFTHRPKIRFSPRRGDSLHQFTSNLAQPTGTWVRLVGCTKFYINRCRGGNAAPKYQKFPFLVKSRATPWPISKIFRGFYTPNYRTLVFRISCDSLHRLRSYCWETARPSIRPNFSLYPRGQQGFIPRGAAQRSQTFVGKRLYIPIRYDKQRPSFACCVKCVLVLYMRAD